MANPFDQFDKAGPVYGAPPSAAEPYKGPQAQATLTRTQQEIKQAEDTAAATTIKTNAEAQTARLAAKTAQENYDQAHVAESPALVGLTGPALLSKLPGDEAPMIKAMIEGRMAPPTASALKDPQWQQRLKWANQVDPDFNEARWQMRVKTMGDAATGRLAQANNAINTSIGHAGLLMDQASSPGVAGHGNWPLVPDIIPTAVNALQNAANKGNPDLTVYNDTAGKLGTEEARTYQGGSPNEGDTNRYIASLSANLPFDAKKAVIHNALELFASKITANLSQYDFGTTGGKPPLNVLDKPALDTLQKYAPDVLDKYFYHGFIGGNSHDGGAPGGDPSAPTVGAAPDQGMLQTINNTMLQMFHKGASTEAIVAFGRRNGVDPNPDQINAARQRHMDVQFVQPPQQGQPQSQPQGMDQQHVSQPGIGQQLVDNTVNDVAGIAQGYGSLPDALATGAGKIMSIVPTVLGYHDVAHSLANPVTVGGTVEGIAPTPDTTGGKINRFAGQMLGAGMSMPQSAVDSVLARVFGDAPKPPLPGGPAPVIRAGQQEGVTVPRAMANPALEPKVIATGKTMTGARVMGGGMAKVGNQIQDRVNALGQGGTPLEPYNAGETVQGIGKRFITQSSQAFNRQYDNLRAAAKGVPLSPNSSVDLIDSIVSKLNETPGINAKEITYLNTLKSDIASGKFGPVDTGILDASGKPIMRPADQSGLSITAARDIGSKLSKDIRKGDVTFGPAEKDVLQIKNAVADDIASSLTNAGRPNLAAQFKHVDGAYQERMDFVRNTIQKLTGPRNAPLAPEQAASRIQAWAKGGDSSALGKIMAQATPDEQANIAATFADSLGKNAKGEFSTAILANNAQKMPERVRSIIFGADGAKSLENITRLANEHARVTRALGGSPTGLALDARSWVLNTLFGAGGAITDAAAGGGLTSSAIAGAATTAGMAGVKTAKNILSARALMSPKITGWLRSTPRTTDPAAINAWYDRLKGIAAREPALAPEIQRIRDSISNAANSNVTPAAAASGTDQRN